MGIRNFKEKVDDEEKVAGSKEQWVNRTSPAPWCWYGPSDNGDWDYCGGKLFRSSIVKGTALFTRA